MERKTNVKKGFCPFIGMVEVHEEVVKPPKTAVERIEALRANGHDVSHLFAMQGSNGGECIGSNKGGKLVILDDDDPIFDLIVQQGTVPNPRLFRRFVMAQMFHMMSHIPHGEKKAVGFTEMLHRRGYEYQWKMTISELNAQMMMEGKDVENFRDHNRWFNVRTVTAMANDYMEKLLQWVEERPTEKCKGIPYKRVAGENIFLSDLAKKLYNPLYGKLKRISQAKNAAQLYDATKQFNELRVKLDRDTPQCATWIDAYKGTGAYFTMQNLIRFHNCSYVNKANYPLNKTKSLEMILFDAELYKNGEGWRLFGVMKKMLRDNNINVAKKVAQWRNKKR